MALIAVRSVCGRSRLESLPPVSLTVTDMWAYCGTGRSVNRASHKAFWLGVFIRCSWPRSTCVTSIR